MKRNKKASFQPWLKKVFVIAEAGVNHNGDIRLAKKLIDAAIDAGADAVKFQTWKAGEIVGKFCHKVAYLEESTGKSSSMEQLLEDLCLSYDAFRELQNYATERGILFLTTPDGFESLNFVADELQLPILKIGSTEVTHLQFLAAAAKKKRPIILSTGLSTLKEVATAVKTIRRFSRAPLALLHCTSEYPAPHAEMNVRAISTLQKAFKLPIGLSDHSIGAEAAIAAVTLGAVVIEKHFTLDKTMSGPDHPASLNPQELRQFIQSIRLTERVLGDGIKRPTASERRNMSGIRRSVVAAQRIDRGTTLTRDLLTCKRPGTGLAPALLESVIGKKVRCTLEEDQPIQWKHLQ